MIAADELSLQFIETMGSDEAIHTHLLIANHGKESLRHNWRLYFSLGLKPIETESRFKRVILDGRYGFLEPTEAWQPLAPGASVSIEVESWLFSGMDLLARQGFHVVAVNDDEESLLGEPIVEKSELQPLTAPRLAWIADISPSSVGINAREETNHSGFPQAVIPMPSKASYSGRRKTPSFKVNPSDHKTEENHLRLLLEDAGLASDSGLPISLTIHPSIETEGYRLELTEAGVSITGGSNQGVYYGIQSFRQILANYPSEATIEDHPAFAHRALFLDIARHFHDKDQLCKIIEIMGSYKLNRLQLGISNDEGWRLEIPQLPELTDIGSLRSHNVSTSEGTRRALYPAWGDGPENTSGHLSANDFVELLKFAAEHHVEIIPEFNLPGHANALLRSLEDREDLTLVDPEDQSNYRSAQGYTHNVVNVAMPDTYKVADIIITQIAACYSKAGLPLKHLHLGGDEVPPGAWLHSPRCRQLSVWDQTWDVARPDDAQLATNTLMQFHFQEISKIAHAIVPDIDLGFWHEMSPHGSNTSAYFNGWVTEAGDTSVIDDMLTRGQRLVISNASFLYLDMPQALSADEPGLPWAGYIDLETIYHFDPLDCWHIPSDCSDQVLGLQAQLWSETVCTSEQMEYYLFPRLLAVAERAWNVRPDPSGFSAFAEAVEIRETNFLQRKGINLRTTP